jgi:hypothetical protein
MFERLVSAISHLLSGTAAFLVKGQGEKQQRWLTVGWIAGVFLIGLFFWGQILNWGHIPFNWLDWAEVSAPRIAFVRDAVIKGQLPLHMPDGSALRNVTDRYMALPDVMLSPQMVLLRWMDVQTFVLVNTWFLYALGFLGLLWFWRKYHLSPVAFAVMALLFSVNGHIVSHFSVGHANYGGYFLFPWLLALVIHLLEKPAGAKPGWGWVSATAGLLFFILLQGSFHQFIWGLMFLGLVGLFSWQNFAPVLKALVFTCLLSMVRLLPPALELGKFDDAFLTGYPSVNDVWNGLTALRLPSEALNIRNMLNSLGWWEFDLYVGLLGAAFLVVFGLILWIRQHDRPEGYGEMLLPIAILFVLSIGRVYQFIQAIPIPLLNGERVSSRMIILPFVVLLCMGTLSFQKWLETHAQKPAARWAIVLLLLPLVNDLWQHGKAWRVNVAYSSFPVAEVNLAIKVVHNHADAPYTAMVAVGTALTLLTAVFLGMMVFREKRFAKSMAPVEK